MKISFVFGTHEWNYLRHCLSLQSGWLNFRTFLVATILIISLRLGYASRLYTIIYHCKFEENLISSYENMTHEMHTIIFTNSRKRDIGFTQVPFKAYIS